MPQRAILNEHTNVLAYSVDEETWSGLAAAYRAEYLRLPCCGNLAIPKTSSLGTKFFAHGPHKRVECDWKTITAKHEQVIAAIANSLKETEWNVETEARHQGQKIDILCTHRTIKIAVAIMLELKERVGLETEEAKFRSLNVPCLWIVSSRLTFDPIYFDDHLMPATRISTDQLARDVKNYLSQLEKAQHFIEDVKKSMSESGIHVDAKFNRGIPSHINVKDSLHGFSTQMNVNFRERRISFDDPHFQALSPSDRERCIRQFDFRVGEGIKLWWPGYPNLNDQTFKPLADHVEVAATRSAIKNDNFDWNSPRQHRRNASVSYPRQESGGFDTSDWGRARERDLRNIAGTVMDAGELEKWLDTRFEELDGLTPRELAYKSSSAIQRCEVLLGLRDPVTGKPTNFSQ